MDSHPNYQIYHNKSRCLGPSLHRAMIFYLQACLTWHRKSTVAYDVLSNGHFGVCPIFQCTQIYPNNSKCHMFIEFIVSMMLIIYPRYLSNPHCWRKPYILLIRSKVWCSNLNVDLMLLLHLIQHLNWCLSWLKFQFGWFNPNFDG